MVPNSASPQRRRRAAARRVVVLEDDAAVCDSLDLLLEVAGFRSACFTAVAPFLAAVAAEPPDCMVLDLHLAETDATVLLRQLRARGVTAPTVAISADFGSGSRAALARLGVTQRLEKPFDGDMLLAAIRSLLDGRGT